MSGSILLVAAEASGAQIASAFINDWRVLERELAEPPIQWFGVGSQEMENLGFERLGKAEELAVVGFAEAIEHYADIKKVFDTLVNEAANRRPRLAVLIDYPGFNLRLAEKLHVLGITVVYYVSPQVWAWKKGRVKTIRKYCKLMLVLFPFEKKFYEDHQVPVEFVGHPMVDSISEKYFNVQDWRHHRHRYGISDDEVVIGLMPGSRRGEVIRHLAIQMQVARRLHQSYPRIRIVLCLAPTLNKDWVLDLIGEQKFPYMVLQIEPLDMIHITDLVLVASGTATLQVGLLHKPMVIMYRMNWLTGILASLIVRGVKYFGLVNLILDREVCPERYQSQANVDELTELMKRYLEDQNYREGVIQDLKKLRANLGEKGGTRRAVQAVRRLLVKGIVHG